MDHNIGPQRALQPLIRIADRLAQKAFRTIGLKTGDRQPRAKDLLLAEPGIIVGIRHNQRQRVTAGYLQRLTGAQAKVGQPVFSAGVVVRAGIRGDLSVQLIQQGRRRLPALLQDQHLAGHAVKPAVVHLLRRQLLRLKSDVRLAPRPGYDNGGADAAQLRGHPTRVQRRPGGPTLASRLTLAPDDDVMGVAGASDMDLIDSGMGGQPRSRPGVAGDDAERIHGNQRRQGLGQQIVQIIIHRIELQQADLILNKQLV
ncbi:Uncharacterised protein [Klebsiella pneumoniae]|uniref:Uncharacterized protein n=1 Tax=Klebsiella pneumoniae TaxID=573 RepID=A0A377TS93_KLEPN|nr:Uncharacterised protein [Klebsiella pneumoniae]